MADLGETAPRPTFWCNNARTFPPTAPCNAYFKARASARALGAASVPVGDSDGPPLAQADYANMARAFGMHYAYFDPAFIPEHDMINFAYAQVDAVALADVACAMYARVMQL